MPATTRRGSLPPADASSRQSCEILGVTYLEMLGYRDSGMMGWPQNDAEGSFWTTPVADGGRAPLEAHRALPPASRRHLRRERVLRPSRPHPGAPDNGRSTGRDADTRQALLPRDPQVGHGGVPRDASQRGGPGAGRSRGGLGLRRRRRADLHHRRLQRLRGAAVRGSRGAREPERRDLLHCGSESISSRS